MINRFTIRSVLSDWTLQIFNTYFIVVDIVIEPSFCKTQYVAIVYSIMSCTYFVSKASNIWWIIAITFEYESVWLRGHGLLSISPQLKIYIINWIFNINKISTMMTSIDETVVMLNCYISQSIFYIIQLSFPFLAVKLSIK